MSGRIVIKTTGNAAQWFYSETPIEIPLSGIFPIWDESLAIPKPSEADVQAAIAEYMTNLDRILKQLSSKKDTQ
jgi:hypothetical protein